MANHEKQSFENIIDLILDDVDLAACEDDFTRGYLSGIIDAYLYLKTPVGLTYYPWNGKHLFEQPKFNEVLEHG